MEAAPTTPALVQDQARARLAEVLAHIDQHLDEALSLDRLSGVAGWSKFHFQRQFTAAVGLGVHEYVQLARLKRAAHRLAFRDWLSVLDVALDSGYGGPEAFARAFKRATGQSPSAFREQPQWRAWQAGFERLHRVRRMQPHGVVRTVQFPETRVAVLDHRGEPGEVWRSVRRFIAWRRAHGLTPPRSATFNRFHDAGDGGIEHVELCAGLAGPMPGDAAGIVEKTLPAARCAVVRHVGGDEGLADAALWLYAVWLPGSGEAPGAHPLFMQRVAFYPDVPEHRAHTDIFLPLA